MTNNRENDEVSVDVVIPVYNERQEALEKTLRACFEQTYPIRRIFIVDDGSNEPVSLPIWARSSPQVSLLRHSHNQGISAARNQAIACSNSSLLACVNVEVLPDRDWLAACEGYLSEHPNVGACYTRVVPESPDRLLTRWRIQFHEQKYNEQSGPCVFAPGHAVLFRKKAVDSVGGYDPRYRRNYEDSDICERMRRLGWETHYVAKSRCVSTQKDSLRGLAAKQLLRDSCWSHLTDGPLIRLYFLLTKWTLIRAGRNLLQGRVYFLPIDAGIWACGFWKATTHALHESGLRSMLVSRRGDRF
jgi:cellulose synthase/poly-beta-1,6-N-acetylglucosamine synthase-like glycosyltransferase